MRTVVISGLSGAGKSAAAKMMEDIDFYCIDNLPVALLSQFLRISSTSPEIQKLALVIDARDKSHITELPGVIAELSEQGRTVEVLFLEASDGVLERRFKETRRKHPLSLEGSPMEGIKKERQLLAPIQKIATHLWDTSDLKPRDLRQLVLKTFATLPDASNLAVQISSFGFKYGIPLNADMVLDVRFLPNPFFRDELKNKPGTDADVISFVMSQDDTVKLLDQYRQLFGFLIPRFDREGKSYLHIAIGCTGGRHRSVVLAEEMVGILEKMGCKAVVTHRDLQKEEHEGL